MLSRWRSVDDYLDKRGDLSLGKLSTARGWRYSLRTLSDSAWWRETMRESGGANSMGYGKRV